MSRIKTKFLTDDAVTNPKLANMATQTFKGRTSGGTGDPEDLTATQATAMLNTFVGDTGAGGLKGLVPAPATGDATKVLKGDGTWSAAGSGTVTSVSVVSANGLAGTVATSTTTPAITLSTTITGILQGNGTAISAASTTGSGNVVLATSPTLVTPNLGTPSTLVGTNITGTAASLTAGTVTTNANLTGDITSTGNATTYSGTVPINKGGTGQITASAAFNALSPMTTLGDTIYGATAGSGTRLAGNTTATKKFLTQTGTGTVSAAPTWDTIVAGDVPTLNQNTTGTASNVTGTVAIANGGTGQTTKAAAFDALSPTTTKGDLIVYSTTNIRQAVGANDTVLVADSAQTSGIKWGYPVHTFSESINNTSANWSTLASAGAYGDMTSLTLAAGTWAITYHVQCIASGGAVTATEIQIGIGTTSGNSGAGVTAANFNDFRASILLTASGDNFTATMANYMVQPGGSTTYYLKGNAQNTTNLKYTYRMTAIRIA